MLFDIESYLDRIFKLLNAKRVLKKTRSDEPKYLYKQSIALVRGWSYPGKNQRKRTVPIHRSPH